MRRAVTETDSVDLGTMRKMDYFQDQWGNVGLQNRISLSRGAFRSDAGSPVLAMLVWQGRVDEFQRFPTSIMGARANSNPDDYDRAPRECGHSNRPELA